MDHVDVAFVLDTTGSMAHLIDGAKKKIWSIADQVRKARPDATVRFALIGYRDRGDEYITDVNGLTDDLQDIYAELLRYEAAGGGDTPESVNEALNVAVAKLDWDRGATSRRLVFLVGDAPPHMDYPQDVPFTASMALAVEKGIVVNAVQAGDATDTEFAWRSIAALGKGEYMAIPQSGNMQVVETPYDEQIRGLQLKIDLTVVPYGSARDQSRVEEKLRLKSESSPAAAADMAGYMNRATSKSERKAVTDDNDLVNRVISGDVELSTLPGAELPEPMQAMDAEQRKVFIDTKIAERDALQAEILGLVLERDQYLSEQAEKSGDGGDSFDGEVKETMVRQLM
ncbi:MAG TPA: vWA domain-containing protein [Methylomirabilota bacterium]|nr:vWA domain-containing protein [Methylomirabilota bacterium]